MSNDIAEDYDHVNLTELYPVREGRLHANLQYLTKIFGKFGFL